MKDKNLLYIVGGGLIAALIAKSLGKIMITLEQKKTFKKSMEPVTAAIEREYGIKPVIAMTQAALESGWGLSELTKLANNLFGFTGESWEKAGKPVIYMPTREYVGGVWVTVRRPFRQYKSWYDSLKDWAQVISGLTRYSKAYAYAKAGDVTNFGVAVKEGGYATDPAYAAKITSYGREIASLAGLPEIDVPEGAKKIKFIGEES